MEPLSKNKLIPFFENAKVVAAICLSLFHFIQHSDHTGFLVDLSNEWLQWIIQLLLTTVFLFFIITGYVIPAHLKHTSYQLSKIGTFLFRRILRIYIPFLACVASYLLLDCFFKWYNHIPLSVDWKQLLANITFTANFSNIAYYNPIFWTLAIEMQFYLFIALVFPLLDRIHTTFWNYVLGILIALTGYFWRDNHLLFEYLPMIFSGYFLWVYQSKKIELSDLLILISMQLIVISQTFNFLTVLTCTFFFIGFLLQPNRILFPNFALRTYSFYLFHGLFGGMFLYFSARHVESTFAIIGLIIFAVMISIAGSWITYFLFEKPAVRLIKRIQNGK